MHCGYLRPGILVSPTARDGSGSSHVTPLYHVKTERGQGHSPHDSTGAPFSIIPAGFENRAGLRILGRVIRSVSKNPPSRILAVGRPSGSGC